MKNKNYRENILKKKLRSKKHDGVKVLEWRLSPGGKELIESFGYYVEPILYQINTRRFYNVKKLNSNLLKDLHYLNKRGKRFKVCALSEKDKELLETLKIRYRAVKFRIYLQ